MTDEPKLGPVARRLAATRRVLCVEDEPDIAAFLRAYFRAAGYDFVHLDPTDPDEVLQALDQDQPDLVLLDVRLRGFSGVEAYRRMRADERWAFTPVIVVSGHATSLPRTPTGLDAFVPKPFNTNVLADLVHERIERAAELEGRGRDARRELLTQEYLEARLADEIGLARAAGTEGKLSLAIVRIRSVDDVLHEVGAEGYDHLLRSLVERARPLLPAGAVLGSTRRDEVAVVLPGVGPRSAYTTLRDALGELRGEFRFAGGAVVPVELTAGLASYPANAHDPDGLFMAADAALSDAVDDGAAVQLAL